MKTKIEVAKDSGFQIDRDKLNPALNPHQKDAVAWALKGGRRALFESFGLGKTVQEMEFCHQAAIHTGGRALIVLPLGVKQEFTRDAHEILGYEIPEYCRTMDEAFNGDIQEPEREKVTTDELRAAYCKAAELKGPATGMTCLGVLFEPFHDITIWRDENGGFWYSSYYVGD